MAEVRLDDGSVHYLSDPMTAAEIDEFVIDYYASIEAATAASNSTAVEIPEPDAEAIQPREIAPQ